MYVEISNWKSNFRYFCSITIVEHFFRNEKIKNESFFVPD